MDLGALLRCRVMNRVNGLRNRVNRVTNDNHRVYHVTNSQLLLCSLP